MHDLRTNRVVRHSHLSTRARLPTILLVSGIRVVVVSARTVPTSILVPDRIVRTTNLPLSRVCNLPSTISYDAILAHDPDVRTVPPSIPV